jgi:hypothetical protein
MRLLPRARRGAEAKSIVAQSITRPQVGQALSLTPIGPDGCRAESLTYLASISTWSQARA